MKVKVNIINTRWLSMSEAVTVPSLMMTSIISQESLARDTPTPTPTHKQSKVFAYDFAKKKLIVGLLRRNKITPRILVFKGDLTPKK